jgi:DNA-binding beta-propeller fold protein YncE
MSLPLEIFRVRRSDAWRLPARMTARACVAAAAVAVATGAMAQAAPAQASSIRLSDPVRWDYITVDARTDRVYVGHHERVDVIDARAGKLVAQLAPTAGVHGAAPASELGRVFTSNGADGTVGVFEAESGRPIGTVKAGEGPDAIVYEPVTRRVFAFNGHSSDVTAIDAQTLHVLGAIPSPGRPEFAVADGRGHVYFNIEDKGELAVLDASTLKIERHYSLAPCEGPSGLAIDPQGRLYSVCENGWLVVSDPARGKVLGQAPIGHGPDGVAWMDGRAYSANGRDGTISVVAETAPGRFETVDTLHTARGARTIAALPSLHALYTPTADFQPLPASAPPGQRPQAVPGTFRVLVIRPTAAEGSAASR